MAKSKQMKQVKETIGLGIGSMAGMYGVGAIGSMPGFPAAGAGIISTTGAGLNLVNVDNLAKIGMNIMPKTKSKLNLKKLKW